MTPVDEAVGILRGLASQAKGVEPHCVELRTDPEEGTYLSLEYLCGELALWVTPVVEVLHVAAQLPVVDPSHGNLPL